MIICSQVLMEIVEILHCGEDEDIEQVARTSKQISFACDCFSLSLINSYLHFACLQLLIFIHLILDALLFLLLFYWLYSFINKTIVHINSYLREILRRSSELFTEYPASLLGFDLPSS